MDDIKMTGKKEPNLTSRWAQAGAMFLARPTSTPLDLEQLLLDTARHASGNSRLFIMAASWLAKYADRISSRRLATLIELELESEFKPVMGLLLDQARQFSGSTSLDHAISLCGPAEVAEPLFEIERRNSTLRRFAELHASKLSRKWNLWAAEFKPKFNAIRPEAWMASKNPLFDKENAMVIESTEEASAADAATKQEEKGAEFKPQMGRR